VDTRNKLVMDFDSFNSVCDDLETHGQCHGSPTFTMVRTSDLSFCSQ
jgi:hypothetical protein